MLLSQTGATQYLAQWGLSNKGRAIKGLVICNIAVNSYEYQGRKVNWTINRSGP